MRAGARTDPGPDAPDAIALIAMAARVEVVQGDIARVAADAIVNPAKDHLWMGAPER